MMKLYKPFLRICQTFMVMTILCASQALLSQTINGLVSDLETGEPLIGANVFVAQDPSTGTVTDLDGKFTLEVKDSHEKLSFTYVGYKSLTVEIDGKLKSMLVCRLELHWTKQS